VKWAGVSIGAMMLFILLAAADCALARRIFEAIRVSPPDLTLSLLVMANVLALCITALVAQTRRRGAASSFLTGFVITGALGALAAPVVSSFYPETFSRYVAAVQSPFEPQFRSVGSDFLRAAMADYITVCAVLSLEFALPLFVLAALGGWLFQHNGLTLVCRNVRREAVTPSSSSNAPL
jgi:hypothetical protein